MSEPTPTPAAHAQAAPDPAEGHEVVHHNSWAPIIIALSTFFVALGVLYPKTALPIGLLIMFVGLAWWFREDVLRFREKLADRHAGHDNSGIWSMWFFIGSEVVLFGGIFAVWFVGKAEAGGAWIPEGFHAPVRVALINTALLVASGGVLHWGMQRLKHGRRNAYLTGHLVAILLGLVFLYFQVREYIDLVAEGFTISGFEGERHLYASVFYVLTGTHGLHVLGGLVFLSVTFWRSLLGTQTPQRHIALETSAMYWHFVDVVWIFLVAVVYLAWL